MLRFRLMVKTRSAFAASSIRRRRVLKAQINKTDRNDARGMAQMMQVGFTLASGVSRNACP